MKKVYDVLSQYNVVYTDKLKDYNVTKNQFDHFVRSNHYKRISKGTYKFIGDDTYKLYKLNHRSPDAVLSHNTALYYHHMIDTIPDIPSITLGMGHSTSRFKSSNVKAYLVKKELLEVGMISNKDCFGNTYRVYDLDRTIVDLIRNRNTIGLNYVGHMLKEYMKRDDKNLDHLFTYAKYFRVEKVLNNYLELLM